MAPLRFDRLRIEALLQRAGERLEGDWLVTGDAAAAVWFSPTRTTEDIDMIGLGGTQHERFALMELAADAGIPVEAVNSAADFFVRKIDGWRDELAVLHAGPRATLYRPTATLFVLLKANRLTASDLEDCTLLLQHCVEVGERVDGDRIVRAVRALAPTGAQALEERRERLVELVSPS